MRSIEEHEHCRVCGKVAPPGEQTCSRACADERSRRASARQNYRILLFVAMAVLLGVLLLQLVHH